MNRKYNILHLPWMSFFSKRLYRDVGQNWKGANMTYLFLLLAICWIPPTLSLRDDLVQSLDTNQMQIINQLPDVQIRDGVVQIAEPQPYYIRNKNGLPVAIIDTTGSMNYIDDENVNFLLTESKLVIRRGKNQFNTLELSQVSEFHLNREIANRWIQTTKNSLAPLSYGIFLLLSYIFITLLMLLAAVAGLILATIMHSSVKFAGVMRIATAAITPSIILIAATLMLKLSIPGPVYAVVTVLYLLAGIISCRKPPEEEEVPRLKLTSILEEEEAKSHIHAA